ncbi:hypothetical protein DCC39_05515 [Pueribacillus theae]|uniref:Uncharacterized protein n=1 Tax=Pueribacillus theae TaxID=2171751 RepID=A0A2U1K506_9BACI|nr:nodulation protein NfeD [Pueribacillus theae]PWA12472.1 hypothetical protein DCC39_05515 [Pueribacillus theae]
MKKFRIFIYCMFIFGSLISLVGHHSSQAEGKGGKVYFIPVEQEVERGLEAFLRRSLEDAKTQGASHVVFEVNTPGGLVQAAGNIAKLLRESDIPTTAYIKKDALSAGAYISLNAGQIVMAPGSRMGAAAVIDQEGNTADEKAVSAWLADMKSSAELHGRDPIYALAMADPDIDLPEYGAEKGKLLTLTANQALEVGYAEAIVKNRSELLEFLNLRDAEIVESEITISERIARLVTHPVIVPILLSLGSLGLILELYSPGFGIPGIIGLSSLFLFFFGHAIAGFAGWESFILLGAGIILILIEIFTPGFGIFGISGLIAMLISIVMSTGTTVVNSLLYIFIAFIITLAASALYIRVYGYKGFLRKIVLTDSERTELGYVSNETKHDLVGHIGQTVTPLRPSGIIDVGSERLDVVSEGGYIQQGKQVEIVKAVGSRIVVREIRHDKE